MTTRSILKWTAFIASTIWIVLTIYQEFFDVDPDRYGFKSPEVEAQMSSCGGTFRQRYECKETAILAKGRDSFVIWMEKVAMIFGPPLAVSLLLRLYTRRQPEETEDVPLPPRRSPGRRRIR